MERTTSNSSNGSKDGPMGHDELLPTSLARKQGSHPLITHISNPKIVKVASASSKALMMTPPMSRESSSSGFGRTPTNWKIGSSARLVRHTSCRDGDSSDEEGLSEDEDEDDDAPLLFVSPPSDSLRCALHDGLLVDPVIAPCGHSFCRACVVGPSKLGSPAACPVDGTSLDADRVFPNLAVAGQLRELPIRCRYGVKRLLAPSESSSSNGGDVEAHAQHELVPDPDGCPEVVPLGARRLHEAACPYAPAQCPYCDASSLRRMTVAQHTRTCAHIPCPHRGVGCAFEGAEAELEAHLRACVYEGLRGFLAKYEEDRANLVRRLREQRLENMALTDTVAQLTTRLQELVTTLDAKTAHYDSVIQRLTDGQRTNIRPMGPTVLRPPSQSTVMPPAVLGRSAPPPEETDVDSHSFKLKGEFNGHDGPVWALAVNKKRQMLVSGSSDETIRIWDLATFKTRNTLVGHGGIVHAVVVVGRKLISGSSDKTIRVWNLKTMKLERTITGHGNTICKLVVWNVKTFACIATLKGHNHWVWDVSAFRCIKNLTGHYGSIYSIAVADRYILAGTYENAIMVFDLDTFECVRALAGHMGAVYAVCIHQRRLFTGSYDNHIKVWNLDNFRCVQTLKRHTSSVEALVVDDDGLYSASSDNSIKMFS